MRGKPDFDSPDYSFGNTQIDASEINQTLLGMGFIDNLGRTVFFDRFLAGLGAWTKTNSGGGKAALIACSERSQLGNIYASPYSIEMDAGIVANGLCTLYTSSFLGIQQKIGVEFGYTITDNAPDLIGTLDFYPANGNKYQLYIQLAHHTNKLLLRINNTVTDLGTLFTGALNEGTRIQIKLTGDWLHNVYQRLIINEQVISISAYPLSTSTYPVVGGIRLAMQAKSYGAGSGALYVGYVRITKDEP